MKQKIIKTLTNKAPWAYRFLKKFKNDQPTISVEDVVFRTPKKYKIEWFNQDALDSGRYISPVFSTELSTTPVPKNLVFTSVCNDKYAYGFEALLLSLLKIYPKLQNRYLVYHDETLSEHSKSRLLKIYPKLEFIAADQADYQVSFGDYVNHRRIGSLGYLTVAALGLEDADWLIILDTDLLILGDLSALWRGKNPKAALNVGSMPFGTISAESGKAIINSGVIALPKTLLGADSLKKAKELIAKLDENTDPDISRFADQKFWNLFLWEQDLEILPQNYNCIKALVEKHYPEELGALRILHITGSKPWYRFTHTALLSEEDKVRNRIESGKFTTAFALWHQLYYQERLKHQSAEFAPVFKAQAELLKAEISKAKELLLITAAESSSTKLGIDKKELSAESVLIADLALASQLKTEKLIADHYILADPSFWGGRNTPNPSWSDKALDSLKALNADSKLWLPFELKELAESTKELKKLQLFYYLQESALSRKFSQHGRLETDLSKPLTITDDPALSIGVALASQYKLAQPNFDLLADSRESKLLKAN